ncbi:MAG: tryptophan synthase subunit alpha [Kiritimatiellaeota bacterium]|nr:tryptophan synthase subunit alpha [Kiritimatiellota bacterium]
MKLIPFITAGYPTLDAFWASLRELDDNGADIIEIGVPFSDPVADGPVIEAASQQALANGVTLRWILDGLRQRKGQFNAKLVLMGYLNPFLQYGFAQLAADAAEIGVYGLIIPDLPLGEDAEYRAALSERGIHLIPLVAPNTSLERMKEYAAVASGYVYVVSVLGTTGERQGLPADVQATLQRARQAFDLPLALGFGFSHPDQLDAIPTADRPDAIIFGSALIRHLGEGGSAGAFMRRWR